MKLGLLGKTGPAPEKKCVSFAALKPGLYSNPYLSEGIEFTALERGGARSRNCAIRQIEGTAGLVCAFDLTVRLPLPAFSVEIDLIQSSASAELTVFDVRERVIDRKSISAERQTDDSTVRERDCEVQHYRAEGGTFVTRVCFTAESHSEVPLVGPIKLHGFDGQVPVAATKISGRAGDIVTAALRADVLTSLEIEGGPAALIDICTVAVTEDLTRGWTPLFNQPLCLPVEHPDYPCPGRPATFAQAASLALGRIHYGPAAQWGGQNFADLPGIVEDLVVNGPFGRAMEDRTKSYAASAPEEPGMPKLRPLDVVLLASLNPAVAMMRGLYWVDQRGGDVLYQSLTVPPITRTSFRLRQLHVWCAAGGSEAPVRTCSEY
ncbi:MAG: hypothetical protein QOH88_3188 [Verrucomicrobiota bacterium]